jgi:broad specificity phosphatase PhoE
MRLLFVRHGESVANVSNEFSIRDQEKHPLTERGRAQVQAVAEKLRDVKFEAVFASPFLRAQQTAEILNTPHGLAIQTTPALSEHHVGDLDGRTDDAAWDEYAQLFATWIVKRDPDARRDGGESFNDMRARFVPFLDEVVQTYGDSDANILLVAHAGIFHAMLPSVLANVDYAFGSQHILGNAALVVAEQRDGALVCLSWDGIELMPEGGVRA